MKLLTKSRPSGQPPALDTFDLEGPKRKSRIPEIALGLVIVALSGLGSLWWYSTAAERTDVLALRESVSQGETIVLEDLVRVSIATDDPVTSLAEAEFQSIIGQVAAFDLEAGTLITRSMFAQVSTVADGEVVVGLSLPIGRIPAITPLPGETMAVVLVPRSNTQEDLGDGGALAASEILVDTVTVVETAALGTQGDRFLSLSMTEDEARAVTAASVTGQVALIELPTVETDDAVVGESE